MANSVVLPWSFGLLLISSTTRRRLYTLASCCRLSKLNLNVPLRLLFGAFIFFVLIHHGTANDRDGKCFADDVTINHGGEYKGKLLLC